ncbi:hypothetical protein GOBAR_DD08592 [Gossypium barbadense]|nr:hypothetical protein GOBAR_DD08592 [Gossypium barbadense]
MRLFTHTRLTGGSAISDDAPQRACTPVRVVHLNNGHYVQRVVNRSRGYFSQPEVPTQDSITTLILRSHYRSARLLRDSHALWAQMHESIDSKSAESSPRTPNSKCEEATEGGKNSFAPSSFWENYNGGYNQIIQWFAETNTPDGQDVSS